MFRFGLGMSRRSVGGTSPPAAPTLAALTLSGSSVAEGASAGTLIGALLGTTSGSSLALADDAGGRFALSGANVVAGLVATDYETATSHQITVRETLVGAVNSPRDTALTINVSDVVESFDYTITNDADWGTIPAGLLSGGGRIGIAPGSYTTKTISYTPSAPLTFAATNPANKPVLERLVGGTCTDIVFEDIEFRCSSWAGLDATAAALLITGIMTRPVFRRCVFRGNYRGSIADIDVVNDLPEYACIAADVTGDAISGLEITRPLVGDLLADGTYSLDFTAAGGTGATATFTVSAGNIVSTNLTAGGAGYGTGQHRTRRATWVGQRRMTDWLPWGIRSSGGDLRDATIDDCAFKNVNSAIKPGLASGSIKVTRCDFERVYTDYVSFGLQHPAPPFPAEISFNHARLPFSRNGDAGDPHSDFIQFFLDDSGGAGNVSTADWTGIRIVGNIFQDGTCRGGIQGMLLGDAPTGISFTDTKVVGNHIASKSLPIGLSIVNPRDAYVYSNNFIRHDHTDVSNTFVVNMSIPARQDDPGGGYYAYGRSIVAKNITELVSTTGWGSPEVNTTREPNASLGLLGATTPYTSVFANPAGARVAVADIMAAYETIGAHAARGPFAVPTIVDHVNRVYYPQNEPSYVGFNDLTGQTLGATITSEWSRVLGGVNGRAISITGGEFRIASDGAGTGATAWGSASSTVNPGQFVQIRQTASAASGATTTATLTIGGQSFGWNVTSLATPFIMVDNGGTARSAVASIPNETGIRKVVIAFRVRPDALTLGANIISDAAASSCRVWLPSATTLRAQFFGSTRTSLRPAFTPTKAEKTHIITLDYTSTGAGQGCYWATLEDGVLLNNTHGTSGVFDTRSVIGAGTDYGAFSAAISGAGGLFGSAAALGVFAESDGGGTLLDGAFGFLWIDWGGSGYTIPDITQSSVRSKWTSDQIGANGAGPTGAQPKIYFSGDAAAWNAGIANLGSLSLTLAKQAGTYS